MTQATTGVEVDAAGSVKVTTAGQSAPSGVFIESQTGALIIDTDPLTGDTYGNAAATRTSANLRLFNGTNWDRGRSASAANLIAQSGLGAALVAPPGQWSVVSTPAAGTQATASKAAGAAGIRHVYAAATFTHGAIAAPAATLLQANVRDGATGVGTVIDAAQAAVQAAVAVTVPIPLSGKNVPGTAATAMTAEYSASLANLAEGATIQGYDAQ